MLIPNSQVIYVNLVQVSKRQRSNFLKLLNFKVRYSMFS